MGLIKPRPGLTKANPPITSGCLRRLVEQTHHWLIFFEYKHYGQWRHLYHHVNQFFVTFMEDAICHISAATFDGRLSSRNCDINWPPRSWDLRSLDYFLWGTNKEKCNADKPDSIEHLKANICHCRDTTPHTRKSAQKLPRWYKVLWSLKRQSYKGEQLCL